VVRGVSVRLAGAGTGVEAGRRGAGLEDVGGWGCESGMGWRSGIFGTAKVYCGGSSLVDGNTFSLSLDVGGEEGRGENL
jgi:hypothetical protein